MSPAAATIAFAQIKAAFDDASTSNDAERRRQIVDMLPSDDMMRD